MRFWLLPLITCLGGNKALPSQRYGGAWAELKPYLGKKRGPYD